MCDCYYSGWWIKSWNNQTAKYNFVCFSIIVTIFEEIIAIS
jgi:hypothetical protein